MDSAPLRSENTNSIVIFVCNLNVYVVNYGVFFYNLTWNA